MILLVSRDKRLQHKIDRALKRAKKNPVVVATTKQQILDRLSDSFLTIAIVDSDMPFDTVGLCNDIHRTTPALPILYLTEAEGGSGDYDQGVDVCSLLDSTVDTVHGKDLPAGILYPLIHRLIRRSSRLSPPIRQAIVRVDNLEINLEQKAIHVNGKIIYFPTILWRLLMCLLDKRGTIATHDELLEAGWSKRGLKIPRTTHRCLAVHLSRLRKVIGDAGGDGRIVANVPGVGYRLDASLRIFPPRTPEQ